ncbi:hypothetical protein UlMin_023605 [Ulmus minor]
MFRTREVAENLRWHSTNKSIDGKMRHPVDSIAWEAVDEKWPEFSLEPRNLRLGLAADGINPFKNLSSTYSCWPVMLVVYNLSPLLCMKDDNTILTLLIPGPRQPGNDIDIYLEPLIEELKELWNSGVLAYDACDKKFFNMKAMLLWTINDFPAYGNLAGCTTKGKTACPICAEDTCAKWLKNSTKFAYQHSRRFLPHDHPYRSKKSWFNGYEERKSPPKILTGVEVSAHLQNFVNNFGKDRGKKRRRDNEVDGMWKKRSIFFMVHLGREVRLCGPVQFRWMYHFERYMKILKGYVMQPAHPEGSIAERYLADESIRFCAAFLKQATEIGSTMGRNDYNDSDVILEGRPLYSGKRITLNDKDLASAHRHILFNVAVTEPFLEMHLEELKVNNKSLRQNSGLLWKRHSEQFPLWFQDKRFHTKESEKTTQNSGVFLEATTMCRSSAKDSALLADVVAYYGMIKEIILIDYYTFHIPVFKCSWANIGSGIKKFDWYTLVNLQQGENVFVREPFILSSQAKKVFYARESDKSNWEHQQEAEHNELCPDRLLEEAANLATNEVVGWLGKKCNDDMDKDFKVIL